MSSDLFAVKGETANYVDTYANVPAAPGASKVLGVDPDRGRFVRLLNNLPKTGTLGIPVYLKLRDSNGDHIPANSSAYLSLKLSGMESAVRISEKKGNLSHYLSNDITTQRDVDNVDAACFELQQPETEGGDPVRSITVRDIDEAFINVDSSEVIDWTQSEVYIDTDAVKEGGR